MTIMSLGSVCISDVPMYIELKLKPTLDTPERHYGMCLNSLTLSVCDFEYFYYEKSMRCIIVFETYVKSTTKQ